MLNTLVSPLVDRTMAVSHIFLWQLLLASAWANTAQTGLDIRFVGTVPAFQRAVNDAVKHIVLTEHISAISAQQEIEGSGESLDTAIGSIQPDTKSIVGNCAQPPNESPAVAQLRLNEDVPPNACVIEVEEDFMELPMRQGRGATELWLHNMYILTHTPRVTPNASATTILHKDGALYITNTVFQGRNYWNRAIDLSTSNGGAPLLYVGDSVFADFKRDHAAAIRGNPDTAMTVHSTAFKRLTITPMQKPDEDPIKWERIFGSAIGLFENALLWLEDVSHEEQVVLGEPADSKVFTFESQPLEEDVLVGGGIYSQPLLDVWDHSLNVTVSSLASNSKPNKFLSAGSLLQGIREEQQLLMEQNTDAETDMTAADSTTTAAGGDETSGEEQPELISSLDRQADTGGGSDNNVPVIVFVTIVIALALLAGVMIAVMVMRRKRLRRRAAATIQKEAERAAAVQHEVQRGSMHGSDAYAANGYQHLGSRQSMSSSHSTMGGQNAPTSQHSTIASHLGSHDRQVNMPQASGELMPQYAQHAQHGPHVMGRPPSGSMHGHGKGAFVSEEMMASVSSQHAQHAGLGRTSSGPSYAKGGEQNKHGQVLAPQASDGSVARPQSGGPQVPLYSSQSASGSAIAAWGNFFGSPNGTQEHGKPPPYGNAAHLNSISTMTYDASYQSVSLPTPDCPGATLNKELLKSALDQATANRELFLGRFELLGEAQRREGGQGVVQFAKVWGSGEGVAIKFFWNRSSFDCEERLYSKAELKGLMPAITLIENNDSGAASTREGWRYPPFIVVERGESLDEWQLRIQPDFATIVQMLMHMTERVRTLHEQGIVHRDLKPGNILWRPAEHSWTLIDFGCAAEIGLPARLTFSPVYAPPETLQAFHGGATSIVADAAVDIWAIGVMAFELVTHKRAFHFLAWPKFDVVFAALGKRAYDWEVEVGTFKNIPELRVLSKVVHACLQRDPVKRPTASGLLALLNSLYDASLTAD